MVTILKLPLYLEIESDNVDRSKLTRLLREGVYPVLLSQLSKAKLTIEVRKALNKEIGLYWELRVLSEADLVIQKEFQKSHPKDEFPWKSSPL